MSKTDWKAGDPVNSANLNQTGTPLQTTNTTLKDGDKTELSSGEVIVDKNGGLYVSTSGALKLITILKGDKGPAGPKGADGKNGTNGAKGEKGEPGKDGATGPKGADGKNGSNAKQIKTGVINEDKNGIVTGITVTFTDNTTVDFSVKKATE